MLLPILLLLSHFTSIHAAVVGRRVATPTTPDLSHHHVDSEHTLHGRQAQYGYTTRSPGDDQTFNGGWGEIYAPAVTRQYPNGPFSPPSFVTATGYHSTLLFALQSSCSYQFSVCYNRVENFPNNNRPFGFDQCINQQSACQSQAVPVANAYTASADAAATYSSSRASAAYTTATAARTQPGDEQTFTGALGGYPAPAVILRDGRYYVGTYSAPLLGTALERSCNDQLITCTDRAQFNGNGYEFTVDNCRYAQFEACHRAITGIVRSSQAAYSASATAYSASSSLAAYSASTSEAAYSASSSEAAHSASVSAAAYSASATAYSASSSEAAYSASVSEAAHSVSVSDAAYSASIAGQSASAYSASISAYSSSSAAAAASTSIPQGWQVAPAGCIAEGPRGRALIGAFTAGPDMTWKKCTDFCSGKGFAIAGLEVSHL